MKDGALLANSGHFDVEINKEDLAAAAEEVWQRKPHITGYRMTDGWARTNYTYFAISFSKPILSYGYRDMKCEKYMATKAGRDKLAQKFNDCYGDIVSMLKSPEIEQTPKIYMLAIQTMGSVQFAELGENDEPVFMVMDKTLKPKDCAFPLVLVLRNLIYALNKKRKWYTKLKEFLGIQTPLTEYLAGLEKSVKKPDLYKAL